MSHFLVLVLVDHKLMLDPLKADDDGIRYEVSRLLKPYDENLVVKPYNRRCYCVGRIAKDASETAAYKKLGNYKDLRDSFGKKVGEPDPLIEKIRWSSKKDEYTKDQIKWANDEDAKRDKLWNEHLKPLEALKEKLYKAHKLSEKPDPKCEDCDGTGKKGTTSNPQGYWDWYTLGGRWTGTLVPAYDPAADPDNIERCDICNGTGRRDDQLGRDARAKDPAYTCNGCSGSGQNVKYSLKKFSGDIMPVSAMPEDTSCYAVVTPDGKWHAKGEMGWFGCSSTKDENWDKTRVKLFKKHAMDIAVVVDCHV